MTASKSYWANPARRVFALWAVLILGGFIATQYRPIEAILIVWTAISLAGLAYMIKLMPLHDRRMRHIIYHWAAFIGIGMVISYLPFHVSRLAVLTGYLGVFWLLDMGIGHLLNGFLDGPNEAYLGSGTLQVAAGLACLFFEPLLAQQYWVAGIAGALGMVWLMVFATKA